MTPVTTTADQLTLGELIALTGDPSLSMASGGLETIDTMLGIMELPPFARYLEAGCAHGSMTAEVARRRPDVEVFGIDPQVDAIAAAQRTARRHDLVNLHVSIGDARAIPAADGTFNGLFAGNIPVFVRAADRTALIREFARVTANHGWIVAVPIYYPGDLPDPDVLDRVERLIGTEIHRGTEAEWIDLYESAGLHLCERVQRRFAKIPDHELVEYVAAVMAGAANARQDPDRRNQLAEALLAAHRLIAVNNEYAAFSVLGFRKTLVNPGPFVLTATDA